MVGPLLESKYRVPGRRPATVARPRLIETLEAATRSALTVLSAPAVLILVGVLCVLTVVTLRAGVHSDGLAAAGVALVAMRQWTFLIGPGLIPGINALFLGYVMYRARLVPRVIPIIGMVGAPLILTSATVTVLGGWEQVSLTGGLCALPIAVWEFSLGVWLTVKGFRTTPVPTTDPEVLPVG